MTRLAQIALGVGLFTVGTAKAMHHVGSVDPMAAYWCRNGALGSTESSFWLLEPHCWGCGLALLGALVVAHGTWKALAGRVQGATQRPARLRAL